MTSEVMRGKKAKERDSGAFSDLAPLDSGVAGRRIEKSKGAAILELDRLWLRPRIAGTQMSALPFGEPLLRMD